MDYWPIARQTEDSITHATIYSYVALIVLPHMIRIKTHNYYRNLSVHNYVYNNYITYIIYYIHYYYIYMCSTLHRLVQSCIVVFHENNVTSIYNVYYGDLNGGIYNGACV